MTSILFVTQSSTRGGVVTVLGHTLSNWPGSDGRKLILAYNKAHGGAPLFKAIAAQDARIDLIEIPLWDHMWALSQTESRAFLKRYSIKLLNRLFLPILFVQAVLYFRKLCLERAVDVVFSHNGGYPGGGLNRAAIIGAGLAKVEKNYLIVHNLATRPKKLALAGAWLHDTILCSSTSGIIAVSEATASALKMNRFVSKKISVIYNGILIRPQKLPAGRKSHLDKFVVAYVGEFSERKGVHVLFKAIAAIQEPVILLLYGKGEKEYERRLHELAESLGIDHKVMFMGFDPEAASKMSDIDVLVLPSIAYESFGMVLLEAMMQKKPAIVTDVGGMKEVVVDGDTGFVVSSNDPKSLSDALLQLIKNPEKAASFGENGYRRLCEKFSAERMVEDYFLLT
jgi:glycosyltransferase involved in cell wall biosynthesis